MSKVYVTSLKDNLKKGSLRFAITNANITPNTQIVFSVFGTIFLKKSLPTLTYPTTIIADYNNSPSIEINCCKNSGLCINAVLGGVIIKGLSITNAANAAITLLSNNNMIENCWLGLDINGNPKPNKYGIHLQYSNNNAIGSNPEAISGKPSNIISGNHSHGILLEKSSNNTFVSNFIGTDITGNCPIPNGGNGMHFLQSNENQIGGTIYVNSEGIVNNPTGSKGTVPIVYITPPLGNIISGNKQNGVYIYKSAKNIFNGNFIGTNVAGIKAIHNKKNGVHIINSDYITLQGCDFETEPFVYYNVISGNCENGIQVSNSSNTNIQGNFLGIGASNAVIVANHKNGILVDGKSNNTTVGGVIPLGNVCAGNYENGIYVTDCASNFITFNTFGGLYAFQGAAPNGQNGFKVDSTGAGIVARTNVWSGNKQNGILLTGRSNGVIIEREQVGTDTRGTSALPNSGSGLVIAGNSNNNTIGARSASVIPRSTFSANYKHGIHITDKANNNFVNLAFIGLDVSGENKLGNKANGVLLDKLSHHNTIGTTTPDVVIRTNYISDNLNGIVLNDKTYNNVITGNYIGLTLTEQPAPNKLGAIVNNSKKYNNIYNNTL